VDPKKTEAIIDEARKLNLVHSAFEKVRDKLGPLERFRIFSSQIIDVWILIAIYSLIFLVAGLFIVIYTDFGGTAALPSGNSPPPPNTIAAPSSTTLSIIFGTAVFGGYITLIAKLIETSQKRLGTIDLFVSEILSIGRVFLTTRIVPSFAGLYLDPKVMPTGFADTSRSENYTLVFKKNSGDLGGLSSEAINNITAFYSFLKASRDATLSIRLWTNVDYTLEMKRDDILTIIYNCFLMAIHGRLALDELIGERRATSKTEHTERNARLFYAREVFHTIELQCFLSLSSALKLDDPRRVTLNDRNDVYFPLLKTYNLEKIAALIIDK